MKNKKTTIITAISIAVLVSLLIGATYAYFRQANYGTTTSKTMDIVSTTTDSLTFRVTNDINITFNQYEFENGDGNKSGEARAIVTLKPNNDTGNSTMHYYMYLNLSKNTTRYSQANTNHDPELMVQVFDSNNQLVTLTGLGEQKTAGGLTGYDITGETGLILLFDNRAITASNGEEAIENWKIVLTFINLDVKQNENKLMRVEGTVLLSEKAPYNIVPNIPQCSEATTNWNQQYQRLEVSAMGNTLNCTLEDKRIDSVELLNNYIISLENTTQGDGTVIHETVDSFTSVDNQTVTDAGYRYEGKNPNNYVWFNNELWRIIGVFGPESHGQTGKQLVKIIREDLIGGLVWDNKGTYGNNNWNTSSLKALLNGAYYNHTTDTENCYGYYNNSTIVPTTCDYTKEGIQSSYQGMIENVKWYLGGGSKSGSQTYTAPMEYQYERTGIVYSGQPTTGEGYIGLMYLSDYIYGVKASDCARTINAYTSYRSDNCAGKNWLFKGNYEWTISPASGGQSDLWSVNSFSRVIGKGCADFTTANIGRGARPVLYLSSSVYKISGTGTQADPYIIRM